MPPIRALRALDIVKTAEASRPTVPAVASPLADRKLNRPIIQAIFGGRSRVFTRGDAVKLPPVMKGRSIIISKLAGAPLVALEGDKPLADDAQPEWLYRTEGQVSPWHRMAWTLDDLIFSGWSLWLLDRDEPTDEQPLGAIRHAVRCPIELWSFDEDGVLQVQLTVDEDPHPIDESMVCLIPGPAEGLLEYAERTLSGAADLEESWRKRANNPIPLVEIHATDPTDELTDDEQADTILAYQESMAGDHAIIYTPARATLIAHGSDAPNPAIEARNFSKVDVANFLGLPAASLDGSLSTASLTYSTQEGARDELADAVIGYWGQPIQQRLSQDDMVPKGQRVRYDFADLFTTTPAPTGQTTKD